MHNKQMTTEDHSPKLKLWQTLPLRRGGNDKVCLSCLLVKFLGRCKTSGIIRIGKIMSLSIDVS